MRPETPAPRRRLLDNEWSSQLDDPTLVGPAWCRAHASLVDGWLTGLFAAAIEDVPDGQSDFALVAVGGYGRRDLAPRSDIDVWLLHSGRKDSGAVAERLWYPVWDEGYKLGHGVGRPKDALRVAESDLATATTLLSARHLAGSEALTATLRDAAHDRWRARAKTWLSELATQVALRHSNAGEVAFLLEPDLKEGRGGLRDGHAIAWVEAAKRLQLDLDDESLDDAYGALVGVRVALQRRTGREGNTLTLQDQAEVATMLGLRDADELMATVATAARTVAWASDNVWRAVASSLQGPAGAGSGQQRQLRPGVLLRDGAIAIEQETPADTLTLVLDAANEAARHGAHIEPQSLRHLAALPLPLPADGIWTTAQRTAFIELLAAGRPAIGAIEALDQQLIWARIVPEWEHVRNRPQRNPFHTFTVDRHLIEAVAVAAALADRVSRPDLLLLGALLHDIAKGRDGDHSAVGAEMALHVSRRLGLDDEDCATVAFLVEHHLLLADTATRRDLDDEGTVERVAEIVTDPARLDLLAALTEADSIATGPAAWTAWRAELVEILVARVRARLAGEATVDPSPPFPSEELRGLMAAGRSAVLVDDSTVTVVAPDRRGLFRRCAGVLALHGIAVREARAYSDDMAVAQFSLQAATDRPMSQERLAADIRRALQGRIALRARLAERARAYERRLTRFEPLLGAGVEVSFDNDASPRATVIDVRAPDAVGLLHRITEAFDDLDLDIRSALITTVGTQAVDAFYVVDSDGAKLADDEQRREAERAIRHAVMVP